MNKRYLYLVSAILTVSLNTHAMFFKAPLLGARVSSCFSFKRPYSSKSSEAYFRVCLKGLEGNVFEIPKIVLDRHPDSKISQHRDEKLKKISELVNSDMVLENLDEEIFPGILQYMINGSVSGIPPAKYKEAKLDACSLYLPDLIAKLYKIEELNKELAALSPNNDSRKIDGHAPIMSNHRQWLTYEEYSGSPCPECTNTRPANNPYIYSDLFEAVVHLKDYHLAEIEASYFYPLDPKAKYFIQKNWGILYRIALKNDSEG